MNKNVKLSKIVLSIILVCVCGFAIYRIGPANAIIKGDVKNIVGDIPKFTAYDCTSDKKIVQTYVPEYDILENIQLLVLNISDEAEGELCYEITDKEGNIVYTGAARLSDLDVGEWSFDAVHMKLHAEKQYTITFWSENASTTPQLLLCNSVFNLEENTTAYYAGEQMDGAFLVGYTYDQPISLYLRIFFIALIIIFLSFVLTAIWVESWKTKLYNFSFENGDLKRRTYYIGIIMISIVTIFVHVYKLTAIPYGFHVDEMGMGYDAWCLANFGVDRHLKSFPVYMTNFINGQSALYAYLCAFYVKVLGYSRWALRMPALLGAFLFAFFGMKIVDLKWKKRSAKLLFLCLFTIMPVLIMLTRIGLDCNLMMGFSVLFLYTLFYAIQRNKKRFYVISGICCGVVLYAYAISYLILPVFLLMMMIYLIRTKTFEWKNTIAFTIPLAVLALPLVLVQIVNMFDLPELHIGIFTITKLPIYRGNEITLKNALTTFGLSFKSMFFNDWISYNSLEKYKTMYWVSLPFLVIGIADGVTKSVRCWRKKEFDITTLMMVWFLIMLMIGFLLGGDGPNTNKLNGIYPTCMYFIVDGIICFIETTKNVAWGKIVTGAMFLSYLVSFAFFSDYYFNEYSEDIYPHMLFEAGYEDALAYMNQEWIPEKVSRTTYISEENAIFLLGTILPSPYDYEYGYKMESYQNYIFSLPDEIDYSANYLVLDTETDYAIELEQAGFHVEKIGSWYVCSMN